MARAPEPDVKITEALQPTGILETPYVHPATPQSSPLHEVANALAPLSGDLLALAGEEAGRVKKEAAAKGEAQFWVDHEAGATQATADGTIPAWANPHFMAGYGRMAGLNDAQNIGQVIGPDYQALDKNTDDPKALDKWFFPYVKGKINPGQANNPDYLKAWAVGVQALHGQYAAKYVQDRSEAVKTGAMQNFTGNLGNTIDDQYLSSGGSPDITKLGDSIQTIRTVGYRMGLEKAEVDKAVIDAIAVKALKYKDPALLELMNGKPAAPEAAQPGPFSALGISLGDTEYGAHTKLTTAHTIESLKNAEQSRAHTENARKDKEAHDAALGAVLQGYANDTHFQPTPEQTAAIVKHDPTFPAKVAGYRENILKVDVLEDPKATATLYEDIGQHNGGLAAVMSAIGPVLKTKESIKGALEYANLVENYNRQGGSFKITEDPAFKSLEQGVITHTKDSKLFGSMFAEQGMTDAGRQAMNYARQSAMAWQLKNPTASPAERQDFLFKLQEQTIKSISNPMNEQLGDVTAGMKPTFKEPTAAPGAAPPAPPAPAATPAPPAATPPAPAPAATPAPATPAQLDTPEKVIQHLGQLPAAPKFQDVVGAGVTPEVQKRIQDLATANKTTPDAIIQKMWERAKPGKQGSNDVLLQLASVFTGLNESDHAAPLKAFLSSVGSNLDPKVTAWCARFVNGVLESSGAHGSGSDMARSLLNVGSVVNPVQAQAGDIIVFPRGTGGQGHVGFVKSVDIKNGTVQVLGGNQGGASQKGGGVTVETYPLSSALGVRRVNRQTAEAETNTATV